MWQKAKLPPLGHACSMTSCSGELANMLNKASEEAQRATPATQCRGIPQPSITITGVAGT